MRQGYYENEFAATPDIAFNKEYLLTSGSGAYSASTICGCNTRKYHGLFVSPQPGIDDENHVMVSALDEQVTYKSKKYNLATRKYPNTVYPEGYKNLKDFINNPVPKWVYRLDDCVVVKELLMVENDNAVYIRYTVVEAGEKVLLDIFPFLAFRNIHKLKKTNLDASRKIQPVTNGIKIKLYPDYSSVYIQTAQKAEFISAPDWNYNVEYPEEQNRGYDYAEDLFVPGKFTINLKKGEKLVLCIALSEGNPKSLSNLFTTALKKRPMLETEKDCLTNAAKQFVIRQGQETKIKAGYYWFESWGRDTFISLPGLTLVNGNVKLFKDVVNSALPDLKNGLFPNIGKGANAVYNSVDASLWFIWAIQQYAMFVNEPEQVWAEYGKYLRDIIGHYSNGTLYNIKMDTDGLVFAGQDGVALTWMDAMVNGKPVTPRVGKAVEINALWYNALCFCMELATASRDNDFTEMWKNYPKKIRESFEEIFINGDSSFMADCVNGNVKDWSLRPNQIFALSLPHIPVPEYLRRSILDVIKDELLTPKGLRTLSPNDRKYQGTCEGGQSERDFAYHQGTVWPWLSGHFAEAYLKEYGVDGLLVVQKIYEACSAMLEDQCLYTIPEIYNGDAPHKPVGAVAQAWSVAEFLRLEYLMEQVKKKEKTYKTEMA